MNLQPIRGLVCCALVAAGAACGTSAGSDPHLIERSQVSMGSELTLTAWTQDDAGALAAFQDVFEEFERLDGLMSVWREGSDVVRINDAAGKMPVPVSAEVQEVLLASRQVSEWTNGKFDVTFGALSGIWKFDHDRDGRVPDRSEIAARLPFIDYRQLHIDSKTGTAKLETAGMKVHLGGIGKGYAIDRAVDIMQRAGVTDFMIQSGGDLYAAGRRGNRPWRVAIQDPRGPAETTFAALELAGEAFSTSGDYERYFMRDGYRYHHILDPDTGEPARGCRSVSILAKHATVADGLATGVFILGPDAGMALIERLPDVEGVIVGDDNQVRVSSGLKTRLALLRPPTDAP